MADARPFLAATLPVAILCAALAQMSGPAWAAGVSPIAATPITGSQGGATPAAALKIAWKEKYWNPDPQKDDLVLPMPCGGAMAFRAVHTGNSGGAIGDVAVTLGQEGGKQPYLDGLRRAYVSGAFSDEKDKTAKDVFYMGKYEIAKAQWDAVMSGNCPDRPPGRIAFLPAVDHSKLQFDEFAQAYSLWLLKNAPQSLPGDGSTGAYVRLPTEDEWEFSARGGLAVPAPLFRAPRPPIPDGKSENEYVASGDNSSAGGRVQVIGTLLPDPLGLHDMLGNVAEYVETPFSLVRYGRLHGQAGGVVKRGGDARTPLSQITSATRFEVPPFDLARHDVSRDDYTGARLVIAGIAIGSRQESAAIAASLDRLSQADSALKTASSEEDALALLRKLSVNATTPALRRDFDAISDTIKAARAENNARRDQSIRLILGSAVLTCDQTVQRYLNALAISALLPNYDDIAAQAKAEGDTRLMDQVAQARAEADDKLGHLKGLIDREEMDYAKLIEGLASQYSLALLDRQAEAIRGTVDARGSRRSACLSELGAHLKMRAEKGAIDLKRVDKDIKTIALNEAKPSNP